MDYYPYLYYVMMIEMIEIVKMILNGVIIYAVAEGVAVMTTLLLAYIGGRDEMAEYFRNEYGIKKK